MNKRIKCTVCVIAASVLLSGCNSDAAQNEAQSREISRFSNLCSNGELYMDINKAMFYDFLSMTAAPLCSKPNCPHTDDKTCSAYNMHGIPFIYNEKIYYFDSEIIDDGNNNFSDTTDIYISDLDGTDRSVVKTIENLWLEEVSNMFIVGNNLYLFAEKHNFSEHGEHGREQTTEIRFCKFNLSDYSFTDIALLGTDYSNKGHILGVFNDSIYFYYDYLENPEPLTGCIIYYKHKEYKYDLKSKEITESDIDNIRAILSGWVITENDSSCTMRNEEGKEITLENRYSFFDCIVNDIAFSGGDYCVDTADGKKYSLNLNDRDEDVQINVPEYRVKDYIDGKYIVQVRNYAENSIDYISLAEDELIGEEIE